MYERRWRNGWIGRRANAVFAIYGRVHWLSVRQLKIARVCMADANINIDDLDEAHGMCGLLGRPGEQGHVHD
jgi:hypothetical protein